MLRQFDAKCYLALRNGVAFAAKPFSNRKGEDGSGESMVKRAISLVALTVLIVLVAGLIIFASGKANTMKSKVQTTFGTIEALLPN